MRIGAGECRGRTLKTPKGEATRPTSGMVRETLYNIVALRLPGARVLDLFAGCGSVGLEALSRGAGHATFVEKARPALTCLQENIRALGMAKQAVVLPLDVARALTHLAQCRARNAECEGPAGHRATEPFDIIFLDPPFAEEPAYRTVLESPATAAVIAPNGLLVAQHDARLALPDTAGVFTRSRQTRIGDNMLSFYRYEE